MSVTKSENAVTTIIPTQGRGSLLLAVESALQQIEVPNHVLVVVDGDEVLRSAIEARLPHSVEVIATGCPSNGNVARNQGIKHTTTPYIAFLDDDDIWLPGKLERQLAAVPSVDMNWISTCSLTTFGLQNGKKWPARQIKDGEDITEYLFNREQISSRPRYLQVSTWLAPSHVFKRHLFDEELRIHQDFDWIIRRIKNDRLELIQVADVFCQYRMNPALSVSASSKWKDSRDWLYSVESLCTERSRAEFLLLVTQAFAVRDGELKESILLISEARRLGTPSVYSYGVAFARVARYSASRASALLPLRKNRTNDGTRVS